MLKTEIFKKKNQIKKGYFQKNSGSITFCMGNKKTVPLPL
jgi:hypothetical protein